MGGRPGNNADIVFAASPCWPTGCPPAALTSLNCPTGSTTPCSPARGALFSRTLCPRSTARCWAGPGSSTGNSICPPSFTPPGSGLAGPSCCWAGRRTIPSFLDSGGSQRGAGRPCPLNEVPDWLFRCDVLLELLREDRPDSDVISGRLYEYLSTGKPIVSMLWPEQVEIFPTWSTEPMTSGSSSPSVSTPWRRPPASSLSAARATARRRPGPSEPLRYPVFWTLPGCCEQRMPTFLSRISQFLVQAYEIHSLSCKARVFSIKWNPNGWKGA